MSNYDRPTTANLKLFTQDEVFSAFKNKKVVFIGDSVYRCMYKDLVWALQAGDLVAEKFMKIKGEASYMSDSLIYRTKLTNGQEFHEVREYQSADGYHLVHYYFVTRCYNKYVDSMLKDFEKELPDIIIMNSTQWDVSRYPPNGKYTFVRNMHMLLTRLKRILRPETVFLWCTALPLSSSLVKAGFLQKEMTVMSTNLRVFILEANYIAAQLVTAYGFNVLDLHYYFRTFVSHRKNDGVHWDPWAHRHMTELIMVYLYDTWGLPLPERTRQIMKMFTSRDNGYQRLPNSEIKDAPSYIARRISALKRYNGRKRKLPFGYGYTGATKIARIDSYSNTHSLPGLISLR